MKWYYEKDIAYESIDIDKVKDYNTPICQDNFLKNFIP